jgi:bifunctional DNA-binding transcriptional regulator/antitoxin component of YhaV-PrlF toxin-antitoxin module
VAVRKKLGLKEGDKVMFLEVGKGVQMVNSSILALENAQAALVEEAEKSGLTEEKDIVDLCREIRNELYQERYEDND